jgi:RimJ/RimL family protein N-acetyltransferase
METMKVVPYQACTTDVIGRVNRFAFQGRLRRFWGNVAEILWIERVGVYSIDLAPQRQKPPDSWFPNEFSKAGVDEVREMSADPDLEVSQKDASYYIELLEKGNLLLLGKADGKIVFYGVINFRRARIQSKCFLLREDEFYISRCFTAAAYRGRGIYPLAIRHICGELANQGYRVAYVGVATHNDASIRGVLKAGARLTGSSYLRVRVLGRDVILPRGSLADRYG